MLIKIIFKNHFKEIVKSIILCQIIGAKFTKLEKVYKLRIEIL